MRFNALALQWGIGEISLEEQKSGRVYRLQTSTGQNYYLKRHDSPEFIPEYPVLQSLNQRGIRTELPLLSLQGKVLASDGQDSYALYPGLPGAVIDVHYSAEQEQRAFLLGRAIGQLHHGLAQYPTPDPSPFPHTNLLENVARWNSYLREEKRRLDMDRLSVILDELGSVLPELYPHLTQHLIHRDSHPSNIVFDQHGQPGFLDFELLRTAVRIFDPCYCSTSLLMDADDEAKRRAWPSLFRQVIAGYESQCPLNNSERKALRYVVFAIQIIFIGWWVKNGNDEQADLNAQHLFWLYENCPEL